jgi:bifunctional ADP-heptose synthase (sugar kinase/adenylyltransferase)
MSNVLVIGDSCKDIFIYGNIERICPEAPVPVFKPTNQIENDGMSKNVIRNLEVLGCQTELVSNDNSIKKIRYVDNRSNQMVIRIDEHDYCRRIDESELDYIKQWGKTFDAVIISDYCKGFLIEDDIDAICLACDNIFIDTKKRIGNWIRNASFIKINEFEHQKNFELLPDYPDLQDKLIITKGSDGCVYMDKEFPVSAVPVKDVSGAGDTFLAGLVCEYIKSKDIEKAIKFAQECTTKVVQKHGVSTI